MVAFGAQESCAPTKPARLERIGAGEELDAAGTCTKCQLQFAAPSCAIGIFSPHPLTMMVATQSRFVATRSRHENIRHVFSRCVRRYRRSHGSARPGRHPVRRVAADNSAIRATNVATR